MNMYAGKALASNDVIVQDHIILGDVREHLEQVVVEGPEKSKFEDSGVRIG